MNEQVEMISLDAIEPHPANRRVGGFDETKLAQLAESIRAVGVQQPAIVRRLEGRIGVEYQLVAGERRWRATRLAGLDALPCIVRELDDVTALKIQYIENLQRDDVHPLDEADGYARLLDDAGYTVEQLAGEVGKSASYIYQRLKLSSLVPEARELFVAGTITAGHAILIARLGPEQQRELADGFNNGELEGWDDEVISVRGLAGHIKKNLMLEMSSAAWKLDDAELLPGAGACRDCPKRTGYNPELFADVCNEDGTSKDYCTDQSCFGRKRERVVEVKRAELAGEDVVEVADGWAGTEVPKTVVRNYDWKECSKKTPGAKKVLVVAGNQPGRVTYGVIDSKTKSSGGGSKELAEERKKQKEREKKEAAKRREAEESRVKRIEAVLEASALYFTSSPQGKLPLEALRICVLNFWDDLSWDRAGLVIQAEGWDKSGEKRNFRRDGAERIGKMAEAQLHRFMLRLVTSGEMRFSEWATPTTRTIDALEKVFGVGKPAKSKVAKKAKKGAK